jgi:hypothetical protein
VYTRGRVLLEPYTWYKIKPPAAHPDIKLQPPLHVRVSLVGDLLRLVLRIAKRICKTAPERGRTTQRCRTLGTSSRLGNLPMLFSFDTTVILKSGECLVYLEPVAWRKFECE